MSSQKTTELAIQMFTDLKNKVEQLEPSYAALTKRVNRLEAEVRCSRRGHKWTFASIECHPEEYSFGIPCDAYTSIKFRCKRCAVLMEYSEKDLPAKFRKIMDAAIKPPQKN